MEISMFFHGYNKVQSSPMNVASLIRRCYTTTQFMLNVMLNKTRCWVAIPQTDSILQMTPTCEFAAT